MRTPALLIVVLAGLARFACAAAPEDEGPGGVRAEPVKAAWQFSTDGEKTFADAPPGEIDPTQVRVFTARATFNIDDPAAVACLWLAHDDSAAPGLAAGAFCLGDYEDARNKNCGATPLWQNTKAALNGKDAPGALPAMMYHFLPIDPGDALVKGANTLTVSGELWRLNYPRNVPVKPLRLLSARPQKAEIRSGPVLGMVGSDFFTVTCRTRIPAAVTVTAVPVEPAGRQTSATSPGGIYHRLKVPLAAGTRKFRYTVASKVGRFETSNGPFEARLPDSEGKHLRFVTIGNTRCHTYSDGNAPLLVAGILKAQPDLFIHAGQVVELASWDFEWDPHFFGKYGPLLATVPTYLAPDGGDQVGMVHKTFYTPAGESEVLNWTQVFGQVRLIGIDGIRGWLPGSENAKWLEGVLKDSREKFVFVFNHFPGYSSGQMSRPAGYGKAMWKPLQESRDVVLPLLAKYRATAMISALDFDYERCEVAGDKGVTCIIVGGGGAKTYRLSGRAAQNNPFTGTGPFFPGHSFAVFDVKGDTCEMKAYSIDGRQIDQKTFKAR